MRPHHHATNQSHAVKATKGATYFYSNTVPKAAKASMQELEEEVQLVQKFKEVEKVENEVGGLIPDLGCTKIRNSIFFCTIELYQHTKSLVSLGLFPKDEDFKQLKGCMEAL